MQEQLKKYEDKMNKSLEVLLGNFPRFAPDGPIPMFWTRFGWIITAHPHPFSRWATLTFQKPE